MKDTIEPTTVKILDKEYRIACPADEVEGLKASAAYLNEQMRNIRNQGKIVGADRIAVMAAINITHELLYKTTDSESLSEAISKRIKALKDKVEVALNQTNQLEL